VPAPAHQLVLFEDDHLLVVDKPPGVNTHSPGPYAGEGVYDWLRHREPRWAQLAMVHRLDKETSGVMVFAKTPLASGSLTQQFERREVAKKYLLLTDRAVRHGDLRAKSAIVRAGAKYVSRPLHAGGDVGETRFRLLSSHAGQTLVEALPVTGRTHQIRVHAAEQGFPVMGDTLYGGSPFQRVCLHAAELTFMHPSTGKPTRFAAPVDFHADARFERRSAFVEVRETTAYRLVHGAADVDPGWYVDRLGDFLLSQSEKQLTVGQTKTLSEWLARLSLRGAYHKILSRHIRQCDARETSPQLVFGDSAPERFTVLENGLQFEVSFAEGYSFGFFLDQRDNRRRLLTEHVAADFSLREATTAISQPPWEVLNTFAYTCGFSVCAAKARARTTSIDLSRKYLGWGKRNFALNALNPDAHEFIHGEVFDWLRRFKKKERRFDAILLDPPTFSQSKERGIFRAERDYGELVSAALFLLQPGGVLFASTNAATIAPEEFLATVRTAVRASGRKIVLEHYAPQPPDFPVNREEPAYLKTVWLKVA
jgi:23S rRNA (cytosine1962-C5)-methyltransferase